MELKAGMVSPVFEVSPDETKDFSEEAVRNAIASIHSRVMEECATRLDGLQMTRTQIGTST
jgi:hypothetical protein